MDENRFEAAAREAGLLDPRCIRCDYNLRDSTAGRCPECGLPFEAATLVPLAIPWLYRRQIGYVRAYRQTLWFMMRRSAKLKYWTKYPLDAGDAWAFVRWTRWILFAMAAGVTAVLVLLSYRMWPQLPVPDPSTRAHLLPLWKDPALYSAIWWWLRPAILLGIVWVMLGMCLLLGAPTTSRSDPDRERNAVLSIYMYSALAVLMGAAGLGWLSAAMILIRCGINGEMLLLCWPVPVLGVVAMGIERTGKDLKNGLNISEVVYMAIAVLVLIGVAGLLAMVSFLVGYVIESLMW